MKPTYSRRYCRTTPTSRESTIFKKDNQQEQPSFAAPSNQSFFKPNVPFNASEIIVKQQINM